MFRTILFLATRHRRYRKSTNRVLSYGRAERVGGELVQNLKQDPWLIGVAGMVAGAALAALLPPSKLEHKYSGEARDELWNKAVELSHEAARYVRDLAASTARGSKHSAPEC